MHLAVHARPAARDGADGSPEFEISVHEHAGYRIWGRGRGTFLLSVDGRRLPSGWSTPPR